MAPAPTERELVSRLLDELGDAVRTDDEAREAARLDKSGWLAPGRPMAVVEATTIDEVQTTMRIASEFGIPVVPRGAGTGLAGGAIGSTGEIVLSVRGMRRVLEVNVADELAVVEPGILNAELNELLAESGLWWAPDPASKAISSVGGNISTNAGGILCAKYGVTREAVLGLSVVLADGRLVEVGHRSVKGVTGYDLTALMIGSEGTLGIIVGATLKLRPLPTGVVATIGAYFSDVVGAAAASAAITAAGLRPAALELLDAASLALLDRLLAGEPGHQPLSQRGSAYLLVQTDGSASEAEAREALAIIQAAGGDAELTTDPEEGERLLRVRRMAHPAFELAGQVLIEDVAVPRSQLPAMFAAIERISAESGIAIPTIAHAGDGNLHPNVIIPPDMPRSRDGEVPEQIWQVADRLFRAAMELGGTLTGEHGVGLLKRRWLIDELGLDGMELQRGIKAVFDPQGILNPGKVFGPMSLEPELEMASTRSGAE
ncbi:FAD-binding oxidoreductase [Naasia lichenicola]|uniref:FAD-binding protein n=1 Tax=Naasia lichenicola TaxID=2565933 RepID=A0A4S4FR33_9MICO|nr:FAD-linked oxidase C-terminal domain-containing protein [Naasia lichenicola]THG32352.1 FAD-binding protein [Naasia lichenicola]